MRFSYLAFAVLLLLPLSIANPQPKHLIVARSFAGVKETTGHNDGKAVEMFLRSVGRHKGDSWCAAYVSYCLIQGKVKLPTTRSGLARDFKRGPGTISANDVLRKAKVIPPGYLVGWEKGTTISGHIGFVNQTWCGVSGYTLEGNTSSGVKGSQSDGDGVYYRQRSIQPANYFRIRWFVPVSY